MKDFLGHTVEIGDYLIDATRTMHTAKLQILQIECQYEEYLNDSRWENFCGVILPDGRRSSYYTENGYRLPKEDATLYLLQRNTK